MWTEVFQPHYQAPQQISFIRSSLRFSCGYLIYLSLWDGRFFLIILMLKLFSILKDLFQKPINYITVGVFRFPLVSSCDQCILPFYNNSLIIPLGWTTLFASKHLILHSHFYFYLFSYFLFFTYIFTKSNLTFLFSLVITVSLLILVLSIIHLSFILFHLPLFSFSSSLSLATYIQNLQGGT